MKTCAEMNNETGSASKYLSKPPDEFSRTEQRTNELSKDVDNLCSGLDTFVLLRADQGRADGEEERQIPKAYDYLLHNTR